MRLRAVVEVGYRKRLEHVQGRRQTMVRMVGCVCGVRRRGFARGRRGEDDVM